MLGTFSYLSKKLNSCQCRFLDVYISGAGNRDFFQNSVLAGFLGSTCFVSLPHDIPVLWDMLSGHVPVLPRAKLGGGGEISL